MGQCSWLVGRSQELCLSIGIGPSACMSGSRHYIQCMELGVFSVKDGVGANSG